MFAGPALFLNGETLRSPDLVRVEGKKRSGSFRDRSGCGNTVEEKVPSVKINTRTRRTDRRKFVPPKFIDLTKKICRPGWVSNHGPSGDGPDSGRNYTDPSSPPTRRPTRPTSVNDGSTPTVPLKATTTIRGPINLSGPNLKTRCLESSEEVV